MNYIKRFLDWYKYGKKKFYLIDEVDERNFGSDAVYKPIRSDLVDQPFTVFEPTLADQTDSDFCAGYSGAYAGEATEDVPLEGAHSFATAKQLTGTYEGFGTSILQICKARQKFGICERGLYAYNAGLRNWFAYWNNIPQAAKDNAL